MGREIFWLPKDALTPASFERAIKSLVDEWGRHWFATVQANCRIKLREIGNAEPSETSWRSCSGEFGISVAGAGRIAIAEAMLERTISGSAIQTADQPILTDITDRCLDDLLARISKIAALDCNLDVSSKAVAAKDAMSWDIGLREGRTGLTLVISRGALVRWRRSFAPSAELPMLGRIQAALLPQPVALSLEVGRGSLTLAELDQLAIGDVVLLDRGVDAPLGLLAAGRPTGITAALRQDGTQTTIEILEPKRTLK